MKRALFCAIALALTTGAMAADKAPVQAKAIKLTDAQLASKTAGNLGMSNNKTSNTAQSSYSGNARASVYCQGRQCTYVSAN